MFAKNVVADANASIYPNPTNNFFPTTAAWQAEFVDYPNGNYRIKDGSPYDNAGTDGKDLGAVINAIEALTAIALSGDDRSGTGQTPYNGGPFAVPRLFEAEHFDLGGQGIAYHDAVAGNAGGAFRTSEDVDIILPSGNNSAFVVNNIQTGEWLEYTIDVSAAGVYTIELRVSSQFTTSRFHVEIDGVDVTGSVLVPNTGSWGTFQFVAGPTVNLSAGQHVLRVHSEQEYFNLDQIQIR